MRIGVDIAPASSARYDAEEVGALARLVEEAGLDGLWLHGTTRGHRDADGFQWLLASAAATRDLELGLAGHRTAASHPVDLAHRIITFRALAGDRLTLGAQLPPEDAATIRALCRGETVDAADLLVWPEVRGEPRLALGPTDHADAPREAAAGFDAYLCPAGAGLAVLGERIADYRRHGGTRAVVTGVAVDLSHEPGDEPRPDEPVTLRCPPDEAARRLRELSEAGADDVLLVVDAGSIDPHGRDPLPEVLARLRALVDPDPRSRHGRT